MIDGERRHVVLILQIEEKLSDNSRSQHTFIHDCSAGHGAHVHVFQVSHVPEAHFFRRFPGKVKLAL